MPGFWERGQRLRVQLAGARGRLLVLGENVSKTEESYILTKAKFASGGSLALEVLSAQQSLTDARLTRLQALADIQNIRARLERLNAR